MRKLTFRDVRIGNALPWDVFDAEGLLLLRRGYLIETPTQLQGLVERGLYADVEIIEMAPAPSSEAEVQFNPFWLWDDIHSKLVRLLRDFEAQDYAEEKVVGIALLVGVLTDKDADAALGAILLKDTLSYTYTHALHVAVMAAILSKRLGWKDDERRDLLCAALTMNVAMVELQTQLVHQNTPLSPAQREAVAAHPQEGCALLRRKGVANARWLDAVALHHQRLPNVSDEALDKPAGAVMAELVRILDIFCAKITPREYRRAILPPVAARDIFLGEREHQNPLLSLLIKEAGMYMPGTFVKLENSDVALVIRRGASVATPKVVALSRSDGTPYMEGHKRDTSRPDFAVKCAIAREKVLHRLNLGRCWGYAG